jgi:3-deoxy-7-phosphoheptulonate synthase
MSKYRCGNSCAFLTIFISGDNVNGYDPADRTPDPERLLSAYFHSSTTLNFIRATLSSGFADLHNPRSWSFSHVRSPALQSAFEGIVERLEDALDFIRVIGGDPARGQNGMSTLNSVDLWTSHEVGLALDACKSQSADESRRASYLNMKKR